jgi:hypothetical protein
MKRIFTVLILIIGVSHLKAQAVLSNNDMKVSTQTTILKTIFKPNITFPQIMPNVTAMAYSDLSMKSSIKPFKPLRKSIPIVSIKVFQTIYLLLKTLLVHFNH